MKNCKNCYIIRYFIISVLFIIIIALIFNDKMKYLSFVNPEKFSYLIIIFGLLIFLLKLFNYLKLKLPLADKSNKVRNMSRKSSKGMSSKKIN